MVGQSQTQSAPLQHRLVSNRLRVIQCSVSIIRPLLVDDKPHKPISKRRLHSKPVGPRPAQDPTPRSHKHIHTTKLPQSLHPTKDCPHKLRFPTTYIAFSHARPSPSSPRSRVTSPTLLLLLERYAGCHPAVVYCWPTSIRLLNSSFGGAMREGSRTMGSGGSVRWK